MNQVQKSPPPSLDTSAGYNGRAVPVEPENKKRLLELQAELEKTTGPRREAVQAEIEKLKNAVSPTSNK